MEQLPLPPFASISQRRLSTSRAQEPYRYNSYDLACAEYSHESFPEDQQNNTWARESSPMSTSSTISGSDDITMPLYADPLPLPLGGHQSTENVPNVTAWTHQQYPVNDTWAYSMDMQILNGGGYTAHQAPTAQQWSYAISPFSNSTQGSYSHNPDVDTPHSLDHNNSSVEDGTTWETDDSDYESDFSPTNRILQLGRWAHTNGQILQLGQWAHNNDPYHESKRQFRCPEFGKPDEDGRVCEKAFMRVEHLRRHWKTVHHPDRKYSCKVCLRGFSRRDNLRDHYWTHIARGGRAGRNQKMSWGQLTAILGPNEKKLIKRLNKKLREYQEKQKRAKSTAAIRARL